MSILGVFKLVPNFSGQVLAKKRFSSFWENWVTS